MDRPGEHLYHLWLTCCPFSTWAVHIVLRFFHVISPARHAQPDANVVKTHDAACGRALKPLNGWGIVAKRKCRFRCSHGNGESRCTISLHPPHFYTIRTIWLPSHLYPLYLYIYIHDICINSLSSGVRCVRKFWGKPISSKLERRPVPNRSWLILYDRRWYWPALLLGRNLLNESTTDWILHMLSWWWFQTFFIFTPSNWGRFPIWLICFKWVETTN